MAKHAKPRPCVAAFDFKGRPLGVFKNAVECGKMFNVSSSTVRNHVKDGKPVKKNGITFDEV